MEGIGSERIDGLMRRIFRDYNDSFYFSFRGTDFTCSHINFIAFSGAARGAKLGMNLWKWLNSPRKDTIPVLVQGYLSNLMDLLPRSATSNFTGFILCPK